MIRSSDDADAARSRLMDVFDLSRAAGRVHPRAAAAAPDEVLPPRAGDRAGAAARRDRLSGRDSRRRGPAANRRRDELARWPRRTAPPAARCCWRARGPRLVLPLHRSRSPTTRAGRCCRPPACWRAPPARTHRRLRVRRPAASPRRRRGGRAHHRARRDRCRDHAAAACCGSASSTCRRCPRRPDRLRSRAVRRSGVPRARAGRARARHSARSTTDSPGLALGTAQGVVKRVTTDYPAS